MEHIHRSDFDVVVGPPGLSAWRPLGEGPTVPPREPAPKPAPPADSGTTPPKPRPSPQPWGSPR